MRSSYLTNQIISSRKKPVIEKKLTMAGLKKTILHFHENDSTFWAKR